MRRMLMLPLLLVALALTGCRTFVVGSQRDPSVGKLSFERALVVVDVAGYDDSERARHVGEREFVKRIPELNISPSYPLFSSAEIRNLDEMKRLAVEDGFDGFVLIQFESESTHFFPSVGRLDAESAVNLRFRSSVVSLKENRELWSGTIRRFDAYPVTDDVRAVARVVARTLRTQGLVE